VADGRGQETVEQFAGFLGSHGGRAERIREVCQDMSGPYLSGVREHLEQAQVTFDRFQVKQKLSEAIDTVRRAEAKEQKGLLRNTRYLWLKRPKHLTAKQLDWLDQLLAQPLRTARAYEHALRFDHFYDLDADSAEEYLRRWIDEVRATEVQPLPEFADTLEAHWKGVLRWHHSRINKAGEDRRECPGDADEPEQVGLQLGLDVVERCVQHRCGERGAGVVDDDRRVGRGVRGGGDRVVV